jgi:hypothetical protein
MTRGPCTKFTADGSPPECAPGDAAIYFNDFHGRAGLDPAPPGDPSVERGLTAAAGRRGSEILAANGCPLPHLGIRLHQW